MSYPCCLVVQQPCEALRAVRMRVQAAIAALAVLVVVFLLSLSSGRLSPASVSDVSPVPVSEPQVAPAGAGSGHDSEVSGANIADPLMGDNTDLDGRGRSSQSGSGDDRTPPSERTAVHDGSGNASSPPSRPPNTPNTSAPASSGSGSGDDAGVSAPIRDDPDGTGSTFKSGASDSSSTDGDRLEDGGTGSAVAGGSSEDSSAGSTSGSQAPPRPHSSGSGSTSSSSSTMGAADPTPSWKWPRCPPPASAEPAVNLNNAKGMGWNRPTGEPFYYGQCLDADPAPPPCYCPKSRVVQRIERQLREQPVGVFKVGTGGSPKYGVVMKDGSRAMWKPWADGLAEYVLLCYRGTVAVDRAGQGVRRSVVLPMAYVVRRRYLSYKLAQVLGMCHAPPAVPMALVPGISELNGHQFRKTSDRGEARCVTWALPCVCGAVRGVDRVSPLCVCVLWMVGRVKRATFPAAKESKYRSASFGIAVHIVPDVHWFMYTHTLQAAYGFGPRFGAIHEDKNCAPEYDAEVDYGWWNSVVSGRVTDAPWVKEAEAAEQAKADAEAAQEASSGSGAVDGAGSLAAATPGTEGSGVGKQQGTDDDAGGATKARRLAAAAKKPKKKKPKKKKKKKIVRKDGKRCLPNPAVPRLHPSGVSKDHRLQQTRNILAQLSDQHVRTCSQARRVWRL